MRISGIYKIQSTIKPERIYIGSAITISYRWSAHLSDLRKNKHPNKKLQRHFNKYGESDLHFSILLGCDKKDLIKIEQYFIDSYNPYFNICKNAGSVLGIKRKSPSKETRLKQSLSMKGKNSYKHSNEQNKKTSQTMIGMKRKTRFAEHCRKLSESLKGLKKKPLSEEHKRQISQRFKGIKLTDEFKRKLSELKKEYWRNIKLKNQLNGIEIN